MSDYAQAPAMGVNPPEQVNPAAPAHPLLQASGADATPAFVIRLNVIRSWLEDSVSSEGWRKRREEDAHMLANDQFSKKEKDAMADRKQQPLVMNQIHRDYYIQLGRQIKNRKEPTVKPRGPSDVNLSMGLTDVVKYVLDANNWDYEQAEAVKDQLLVRGWIKVRYQKEDLTAEPIKIHHIPWRRIRVDPASRRYDLADCRYVFEENWCDLEDAQAYYPASAAALANYVSSEGYGTQEYPTTRHETTSGDPYAQAIKRGEARNLNYTDDSRKRVRLMECWFYKIVQAWQLKYPNGDVKPYNDNDPQHWQDSLDPSIEKVYGPYKQFYYVVYCGDVILGQGSSPYTHGMYPYFLFDAYRADIVEPNDDILPNEPYSMVALAKDPQKLVNVTFTKIRHILNTRQIVMTKGIATKDQVKKAASDPGGIIELENNDSGNVFRFEDQLGQAAQLSMLLDRAGKQMEAASGINEASRGVGPEQSGRAMFARQDQSEQANSILVDNQRRVILLIGRALVSMIQQSYKAEKIVRITEDLRDRVIAINVTDPQRADELKAQGVHSVCGSVSQGMYDIIIEDAEASASRREMDNTLMVSIIQNLDPDTQLAVMDLLIENTEMRNREEFIQRIKIMQSLKFGGPGGAGGPPPGTTQAGPPHGAPQGTPMANPAQVAPADIPATGLMPGEQASHAHA